MKKMAIASIFVLAATSASFAQVVIYGPGYGDGYVAVPVPVPAPAPGYYGGPAPGYYEPAPGYQPYGGGYYDDRSNPAWSNNTNRGGPGPRVGAGGGQGVGAQR
jgi:hypothetical protein